MYAGKLLATGQRFSALLAFNDMSAIGAIRAFCDAGYRVPQDISVVGFDDVQTAAYLNPRLTTVRQPLRRMGEAAAVSLLERIANAESRPEEIVVEPELIVRESTVRAGWRKLRDGHLEPSEMPVPPLRSRSVSSRGHRMPAHRRARRAECCSAP